MKRAFILLVFLLALSSFASAELIINEQPLERYNLGETVSVFITIKSLNKISENLEMNLICNSQEINFYKNGISLNVGEEKKIDSSLILTKDTIGLSKGKCLIKIVLGEDYYLTNEFFISSELAIAPTTLTPSVAPEEKIIIEGSALLGSGTNANGFLDATIKLAQSNDTITKQTTIDNGFFSLEFTADKKMAAGEYIVELHGYEKDLSEEITNEGNAKTSFVVTQTPKELEIITQKDSVKPGEALPITVLLNDQTQKNIDEVLNIEIKNSKDKLVEKYTLRTNEQIDFVPKDGSMPENFTIYAKSLDLESEKKFSILEKESVKVEVINKTLVVTNTGNVAYCGKDVLVKIGEDSLNINPCLDAGDKQEYTLSAPDGEYEIEVITPDENIKTSVLLTGKSIGVKEASGAVANLTRHPFVWFFVLGVMVFVATTIYRKGFKRAIFSRRSKKTKTASSPKISPVATEKKGVKLFSKNPATLSLSMTGEKQASTLVGLKIKNHKEVTHNEVGVRETLTKIENLVEDSKAYIYENKENIFFIFAPTKTRTFKNIKNAVELSRKIESILKNHNRLFKQKIDFGLSISNGDLIVRPQKHSLEFMSMGDTLTKSKKIATLSKEQVLLDEKTRENLGAKIKTKKITHDGLSAYTIEEMKEKDLESEKFIKRFVENLEKK